MSLIFQESEFGDPSGEHIPNINPKEEELFRFWDDTDSKRTAGLFSGINWFR